MFLPHTNVFVFLRICFSFSRDTSFFSCELIIRFFYRQKQINANDRLITFEKLNEIHRPNKPFYVLQNVNFCLLFSI